MSNVYSSKRWKAVRELALERDHGRCTVARLLGGTCSPVDVPLHAHHIEPVSDGGAPFDVDNVGTTCQKHHPAWEALRRTLVRRRRHVSARPRCPHSHRSLDARLQCEANLARRLARHGDLVS